MQPLLGFVAEHKPYVDLAHALSSVVNLIGRTFGIALLLWAWRWNAVKSFAVGPMRFEIQEEAVAAVAVAARTRHPDEAVDVPRIRTTIDRAFTPSTENNLSRLLNFGRGERRRVDPGAWRSSIWIAASRSVVPLACPRCACTTRPERFSISACPMKQSFAGWPLPLRKSFASGSVVLACVS